MDVIDGIVLAAGRSKRMGRSKALLDAGGSSFLERAVCALRDGGCRTVVVVIATGDDEVEACAIAAGAIVVRNADRDSEQVDSVRIAIQAAADADAVLILPVDVPLVRTDTVRHLIALARMHEPRLAVPIADGEPGHPLLLGRALFAEVLTRELAGGLQTLIALHGTDVLHVDVNDPGIHADIDTPAEYARHFGSTPRSRGVATSEES